MSFQIEDVPVEPKRQGAASKYAEIHQLQVNQSFVVPFNKPAEGETVEASRERQLAALRGVVQQAQARYAVKTGNKRKNRKGEEVDETRNVQTYAVVLDKKGYRLGRTA